jgi:hypothetical protein
LRVHFVSAATINRLLSDVTVARRQGAPSAQCARQVEAWTQDYRHDTYNGASVGSSGERPQGHNVKRGGSWFDQGDALWTASRSNYRGWPPAKRQDTLAAERGTRSEGTAQGPPSPRGCQRRTGPHLQPADAIRHLITRAPHAHAFFEGVTKVPDARCQLRSEEVESYSLASEGLGVTSCGPSCLAVEDILSATWRLSHGR